MPRECWWAGSGENGNYLEWSAILCQGLYFTSCRMKYFFVFAGRRGSGWRAFWSTWSGWRHHCLKQCEMSVESQCLGRRNHFWGAEEGYCDGLSGPSEWSSVAGGRVHPHSLDKMWLIVQTGDSLGSLCPCWGGIQYLCRRGFWQREYVWGLLVPDISTQARVVIDVKWCLLVHLPCAPSVDTPCSLSRRS